MKHPAGGAPVRIMVNGIHPELISGPVACAHLGTSRWTLARMVKAGCFRAVPWGLSKGRKGLRDMRLITADVEQYINDNAVRGAAGLLAACDQRRTRWPGETAVSGAA